MREVEKLHCKMGQHGRAWAVVTYHCGLAIFVQVTFCSETSFELGSSSLLLLGGIVMKHFLN